MLFDLHGYWWSVPMELTIHEVADAIAVELEQRELRGKCVLFDLHGLWWSVPMELTIHEISDAIAVELDNLGSKPLPSHLGDVFRPKVA